MRIIESEIILSRNSWMFSLHPVTKGFCAGVSLVTFALAKTPFWSLFGAFLLLLLVGLAGKIGLTSIFLNLRKIWILLVAVFVFHFLENPKVDLLLVLHGVLRLTGIFFVGHFFMILSTHLDMIYFFERLLFPINLFGGQNRSWAMALAISLRFFPQVWAGIDRIKKAQAGRGICLPENRVWSVQSWKNTVSLLVPTIVQAVRKSQELALAMELRGYKISGKRSNYRSHNFFVPDFLAVSVTLFLFGILR